MSPYRLTIIGIVLVFFSCNNHPADPAIAATTNITAKDSTGNGAGYPTKYVEQARLELKDQIVTLTARFAVVDGKLDEGGHYAEVLNYFVYIDKKTRKADTLEADLPIPADGCKACKYFLRDMTDSFQLKIPVFQIVTPAYDIYYHNSFVGYKNGKFEHLFALEDTREEGVELHRVGAKLSGYTYGYDEVVDNLENDYPVEIDPETFKKTEIRPVRQYIGWETKATESFRAYRVIGGQVDSALVSVKAGAAVTVDTLYRTLGKVRLHVPDSVMVEVKMETAKKKLEHRIAG